MARADEVSAVAYRQTLDARAKLIDAFSAELGDRLLVMPTVAMTPPRPEALERKADYDRANLLVLRNTSLANVMEGCAISLPIGDDGPPVGLMLVAPGGADDRLLAAAKTLAPITG